MIDLVWRQKKRGGNRLRGRRQGTRGRLVGMLTSPWEEGEGAHGNRTRATQASPLRVRSVINLTDHHGNRTRATQASPPRTTLPPPLRGRRRFRGEVTPYLPLKIPLEAGGWRVLVMLSVSLLLLLLVGCGGQHQAQQPDPRLSSFHVLSSRIIMLDTQAEVDGTVQNMGKDRYPFDVTLSATFYNSAGNVIGQAQGTAEDVLPGMTRSFVLIGQVDSARYSRMIVTPVSLRERIHEKNLPSPPPVVP